MAQNTPPPGSRGGYAKGSITGSVSYSHEDFTYVRKKRGRTVSYESEAEEAGDLNIVPYLDIMINLIMFLLLAQTALLGMIDVTAPSYSDPSVGGGGQNTEQKRLRLTVGIAADGFYIAAKGGVLPGETEETGELTQDGVERSTPTIPMRPDGTYNYPALTKKLRFIKEELVIKEGFPENTGLYIAADDTTPYEVIVRTLDASREDAKGLLFPSVAFTQIN